MTYVTYTQLPPQVRKAFTFDDAEEWRTLYNTFFIDRNEEYTDLNMLSNAACYHAWVHSKELPSSRSFTAQVAVEDMDTQGEVPDLEKYIELANSDVVMDGGVGIDKHTSRYVWCAWDVTLGKDNEGRNALIIQGNFFRDKPMFDIVWKIFLRGRSQFSLGTHTNREYRCKAGVCRVYATPNQWFEISIVDVGASPNTGVIDIHVPEGEGSFNPKNLINDSDYTFKETEHTSFGDFCGIEYAYNNMKARLLAYPSDKIDVEWLCVNELGDDEVCRPGNRAFQVTATLDLKDTVMEIIDKWCAEVFIYTQPTYLYRPDATEEETHICILGYPAVDATPLTIADVMELIIDEEDAITMYDEAIGKARKLIGDEEQSDYISELIHIRDEEKEHIEELKLLLGRLLYKQSLFMTNLPTLEEKDAEHEDDDDDISLKDAQGKFDGARICPAGQHNHIGIDGCHDITQTHALDIQMIREGLVDISNEDIDIDAIKGASTERLKAIVLTIAKVVSEYSRPEAMKFMSSSMGKEFALMLTELVDRREKEKRKRDDMSKETEGVISEKMNLDPAGDMQNVVSLLAEIQAGLKQLNQTIMELKSSDMTGREQGGSIADAVSSAVESIGTTEVVEGDGEGGNDAEPAVGSAPEEGGEGEGKEKETESEEDPEKETKETEDGGDDGGDEEPEKDEKTTEDKDEKDEEPKDDVKETEAEEVVEVKETESEPGTPGTTLDQPNAEPEGEIAEKAGTDVPPGTAPSSPTAGVNSGGTADLIPNSVVGDEPVVETTDTTVGELAPEGISLKEGFSDGENTATRTTPPGIEPGPLGQQLESVAEASIPQGMVESEKYTLNNWVAQGESFLGGTLVREVESTPLETNISLKSADPNMKVIEPEEVMEGTGLKYTDGGKGRPKTSDMWKAIGTSDFGNIFEEVTK